MKILATIAAGAIAGLSSQLVQATTIDLITGNSGSANGTIYAWTDTQPTGTGYIDPFLRIQNASGTEQGYNTDLATNNNPWETKAGTWTHDLLFGDLTRVTIDGVDYFEFLLDINESSNTSQDKSYISLNNVQIFTRTSAITSVQEDLSILGDLRYNMDLGVDGDVTVDIDYLRNSGSGSGDMLMYVLASNFAGVNATDYVYFYSMFGNPYTVDAGFEEWAIRSGDFVCQGMENCTAIPPEGTPVPAPSALGLMGLGLAGLGWMRRKQNQNA